MEEFIDRSLNLGLECIDLVQLHCPSIDVLLKKKHMKLWMRLCKKERYHYISVHKIDDALEAIKIQMLKVFNLYLTFLGKGHLNFF